MAYIGNTPADKFQTLQKQSFTTSATDTYTLSYAVTNPQDLALFINNVRQNPNDAYTVSNTTLTLSSAITSSDTMYAVFLGRAVETIAPATGSVTNTMLAGSIANSKLANSSITLNGSAVSLGGSATVGGTNTPAFKGRKTTDQSLTHGATAKVLYETEDLDTDSAFASSRFTVPSGQAGKYFFSWSFDIIQTSNDLKAFNTYLYKNGSSVHETVWNSNNDSNKFRRISTSQSNIIDASVSDYFEIYMYFESTNSGGGTLLQANKANFFTGFKLIGA